VAGLDEPALRSAVERLAEADILFVKGDGSQANYRFKHALIQDAAYESLLKSRRQVLHRLAAEILCDQPERAAAEPEAIAHHFTRAGVDDLAIKWWGMAGDQALRRSAFQEAIAHLGKAIEMADSAGATARRGPRGSTAPNQRLAQLHVAYGNALIAARGFGAPETTEAFLAIATWALGNVELATSLVGRMHARIGDVMHVNTLAFGKMNACMFELMRRDRMRVVENAFELARLVREYDLAMFRGSAVFLEAWANVAVGAPGDGLEGMRRGVGLLREQNVLWFDGLLKIALAEAEYGAGDADRAVALLDEGLATAERTGYRAFDAELHRVRGEVLLTRDTSKPAPTEEAFLSAIAVAKQQGTRSFELRAALSLANLYCSVGRYADAHSVLDAALKGFALTPDFPEVAVAAAFLAAIPGLYPVVK